MLWRVRTTLADRPGALAALARRCGESGVNVLGLQIFPGVDGVIDELVLKAPEGWTLSDVAELVEAAGGSRVSVGACTEHALVDGPTRYLHAVRRVTHGALLVAEALAGLLDAEADLTPSGSDARLTPVQDSLEVEVAGHRVEVRRTTPFTATEHARATAFAEALADLHERGLVPDQSRGQAVAGEPSVAPAGEVVVRAATVADTAALMAMHDRCSSETVYRYYGAPLARLDLRLARRMLTGDGATVVAVAEGHIVGIATVTPVVDGRSEVTLLVEDRWQRRGIGTRLLGTATRQAATDGAVDVVLR
ncbi:MAG: GNAT family N-acetyltransferase, partial [Nocardioides sp.]